MPHKHNSVIILGAGLSGLSAAYRLSKKGIRVTLLEKDNQAGGLAKTIRRGEIKCDLGPHRFHVRNNNILREIKDLIGADNMLVVRRKSKIRVSDSYLEYPPTLINSILRVNFFMSIKVVISYLVSRFKSLFDKKADCTFEEWTVRRFGRALYRIYFESYTEKILGIKPSKLSSEWAIQRIKAPGLKAVFVNMLGKGGSSYSTFADSFYYPAYGGIGFIAESMAREISNNSGILYLGSIVEKVNVKEGRINSVAYRDIEGKLNTLESEYVISTIPITNLAKMRFSDSKMPLSVDNLRFVSIVFVYLVLNTDRLLDAHWLYFPERKYIFNRISEIKNFSVNILPPGKTVLCAEITCNKNDATWSGDNQWIFGKVIEGLEKAGLIKGAKIEDIFIVKEENGYPLYEVGYRSRFDSLMDYIAGINNLTTIGRQGLFCYNNMDDAIEAGFKAADYAYSK